MVDLIIWEGLLAALGYSLFCRSTHTTKRNTRRDIRWSFAFLGAITIVAAVKLQELFGLAESPRLGTRQEPVVFELLAPNGRPVQTTQDLRSFWTTTYAEVRKELRARYPKHPWPDDPLIAVPTSRAKPRR